MSQQEQLAIVGGRPLRGRLRASGSKNAALYALAAALLTAEPVRLHNVPEIRDIGEMGRLIESLGGEVTIEGDDVTLDAGGVTETTAAPEHVVALRASFLVMGPLLARFGEAGCPSPGGDAIGVRPVDVHLAGFRALGAEVAREGQNFVARAPRLEGSRVFLDYPSVLGTVNVLFAATLARGTTTIVNAAAEPEVEMAGDLLNAMGAHVSGHGSNQITVGGVESLHGAEFSIIPDRIEGGTFLLAGLATGGDVELEGAEPTHMDSLLTKLREAGARVEVSDHSVRACVDGPLRAVQLQAVPYPGFPTDLHAPMAAALTQAEGISIIHERVFENRLLYVGELRTMGGRITTGGQSVIIEGPTPLVGSPVRALDVRAAAAVVIAGLAAEGETVVRDIVHLKRGYPRIEERLEALGAEVHAR
ncbi:MAG: UDP-N-acetylglucosamine 1-carboxyvinyltransferase [Chloroflexi bacterium]|nr:UDP-N-acetylglucosamine 1-carboxyvinyltransferase [Chloroflexota bacterium]